MDDDELQPIIVRLHSINGHLWQHVISIAVITSDVMAEVPLNQWALIATCISIAVITSDVMAEVQVFSYLDLTQFCLNETVIIFVILYVHLHS